jgi:hypothetical protein
MKLKLNQILVTETYLIKFIKKSPDQILLTQSFCMLNQSS